MTDGGIYGQQLPVEGGVSRLGQRELSTEEGERLFGAMKNLFEDSTDGDVAGVSGKDKGQTRCWEFEVGGVGECSLCIVEGSSLRRRPC